MIRKTPRNNDGYYDVKITDKNKNSFLMTVGGNLDLYWLPENYRKNKVFVIDKSDMLAYTMFNRLFRGVGKVDDQFAPALKDNTITFISEDRHESEANTLSITQSEDSFTIEFKENENKEAWTTPHRGCTICFCNSGSRVPKVENVFMQMFNFLAYHCTLVPTEDPVDEKEKI